MDELNKAVLKAFASTVLYYYKAHGFHWNLKDKDFFEYHGLFEKIYSEVYDSVDDFAEKIRTLQIDVPGSLAGLIAIAGISEQPGTPSKDSMVAELYNDGEALLVILKDAYNLCDLYSKFGFENFLAERIDAHEKHCWMLRSSM
jgi:starvation-inducible DNA-binding protein